MNARQPETVDEAHTRFERELNRYARLVGMSEGRQYQIRQEVLSRNPMAQELSAAADEWFQRRVRAEGVRREFDVQATKKGLDKDKAWAAAVKLNDDTLRRLVSGNLTAEQIDSSREALINNLTIGGWVAGAIFSLPLSERPREVPATSHPQTIHYGSGGPPQGTPPVPAPDHHSGGTAPMNPPANPKPRTYGR